MPIERIDLADAGSPDKLVSLILKAEPDLPIPVPIEQLCRQLDIEKIVTLETAGFEGGLITDQERSSGVILVKDGYDQNGRLTPRQRFTVGHELGHFLLPWHIPDLSGRFLCSRADMQRHSAKENDRRGRMEAEANRFSSLLLLPPPALRRALQPNCDPRLADIPKLARDFEVSKETMARSYAEYHEELVAIIVTQNGKILRSYRDKLRFPFIHPTNGSAVPVGSLFHRGRHEIGVASDPFECVPDIWVETKSGDCAPTMLEQVYAQQQGFALIMLHLIRPDEEQESEERELERSWQIGFGRRRRRR